MLIYLLRKLALSDALVNDLMQNEMERFIMIMTLGTLSVRKKTNLDLGIELLNQENSPFQLLTRGLGKPRKFNDSV